MHKKYNRIRRVALWVKVSSEFSDAGSLKFSLRKSAIVIFVILPNMNFVTCLILMRTGFYPRDAMLARVIVIATCLSVCPSVCPSVTRRYCVKMKKASGMISSPSGSPKTLVF